MSSADKCPLESVNISPYYPIPFWFVDQSSRIFFSNVEGVVIDKILFLFAICSSVAEIFAIKVESCQKSRRTLDVFMPFKILGVGLPKHGAHRNGDGVPKKLLIVKI